MGVECCCSAIVAAHGHDKCPHLCVHGRSSFQDRAEPLSASLMGAMTVSPLGAVSSWGALCLPWEMCLCLPWVLCKSHGCCLCVPWVLCLFLSWVLRGCCGTHLPSLISGLHFPTPSPNLLHLPCSAHGTQHITHQHPAPSTQHPVPDTWHRAGTGRSPSLPSTWHAEPGAVWLPWVNLGHDDQENLPESGSNSLRIELG